MNKAEFEKIRKAASAKRIRAADPEKLREQCRLWRLANPEKSRAAVKRWSAANPDKISAYSKKSRNSMPWSAIYRSAKHRCMSTKNKSYNRYGGRGIKFLMTKEDFKYLWHRDGASAMTRASIDRIDNDGNYEISNCRFIPMSENSKKRHADSR